MRTESYHQWGPQDRVKLSTPRIIAPLESDELTAAKEALADVLTQNEQLAVEVQRAENREIELRKALDRSVHQRNLVETSLYESQKNLSESRRRAGGLSASIQADKMRREAEKAGTPPPAPARPDPTKLRRHISEANTALHWAKNRSAAENAALGAVIMALSELDKLFGDDDA